MKEEELLAELYDYIPIYKSRDDIEFYQNITKGKNTVCEIGCGTGRILCTIAEEIGRIDGIDISKEKLAVCRRKINQMPEDIKRKITLYEGRPEEQDIDYKYDVILLPFRVFHYLTKLKEEESLLSWIYNHLNQDCTIVMDCFNPSLDLLLNSDKYENTEETFLYKGNKVWRVCKVNSVEHVNQEIISDLIYNIVSPDGARQKICKKLHYRYYFRFELQFLLEKFKFKVEQIYSGYHGEKLGEITPGELVFIAKKVE